MKSVYDYQDYKKCLEERSEESGISFTELAQAAKVHKAYLSQIMRRKGHLNEEQAFSICQRFGFSVPETQFFLWLLQLARSTDPDYQRYIRRRLDSIRDNQSKLKRQLDPATAVHEVSGDGNSSFYYLNPLHQTVHMALLNPSLQKSENDLAHRLGVTMIELKQSLELLQRTQLIRRQGDRWTPEKVRSHIEDGSWVTSINHLLWRVEALKAKINRTRGDYRLSATVSGDLKLKKMLIRDLKTAFARFQKEAANASDEDLFQINIDVFGL